MEAITEQAFDQSVIADYIPAHQVRTLNDLLVPPRFFPLPYQEALAAKRLDQKPVAALDPEHAVRATRVAIVTGDQQSGVSNALLWLQAQAFETDAGHVPVFVRFMPRFRSDRFDRAIRDAAQRIMALDSGASPRQCLLLSTM